MKGFQEYRRLLNNVGIIAAWGALRQEARRIRGLGGI